jgi:hypothetical protein
MTRVSEVTNKNEFVKPATVTPIQTLLTTKGVEEKRSKAAAMTNRFGEKHASNGKTKHMIEGGQEKRSTLSQKLVLWNRLLVIVLPGGQVGILEVVETIPPKKKEKETNWCRLRCRCLCMLEWGSQVGRMCS